MVVNHLSIEVETEAQRYSIVHNKSQHLRNDTSSQQAATGHNGAQKGQDFRPVATGRKFTQGDKTDAKQGSRGAKQDSTILPEVHELAG
jgi:hypothetical protein